MTALNPVLGYEKTTEPAAEAMRSGKSVLDLVRERQLLSEEQIQKLMDVKALTGSGRREAGDGEPDAQPYRQAPKLKPTLQSG